MVQHLAKALFLMLFFSFNLSPILYLNSDVTMEISILKNFLPLTKVKKYAIMIAQIVSDVKQLEPTTAVCVCACLYTMTEAHT